ERVFLSLVQIKEWEQLQDIPLSIQTGILEPLVKRIKENLRDQQLKYNKVENPSEKKIDQDKKHIKKDEERTEGTSGIEEIFQEEISPEKSTEEEGLTVEDSMSQEDLIMEGEAIISDHQQLEEEGIFVQYAGIVMVHPFIHSFFKRVLLVREGRFINIQT